MRRLQALIGYGQSKLGALAQPCGCSLTYQALILSSLNRAKACRWDRSPQAWTWHLAVACLRAPCLKAADEHLCSCSEGNVNVAENFARIMCRDLPHRLVLETMEGRLVRRM
jgi:hypothetical protein